VIIHLTDPSLVLLIGPSGSGKSTFAQRHFRSTQILSSDNCRAMVCDDENDQSATSDAFELLYLILAKRLARRLTTVVDATNVQSSSRTSLLTLAAACGVPCVAIVFQLPEEVCQRRNLQRATRHVPPEVIANQMAALSESEANFEWEAFACVYRLTNEADADRLTIVCS
jgi:protein phosphatase